VIGVLHAASPIDAVQRFIGRMEVGMIPSVLDTIIFIDKGSIYQVLTVKMTVKVPSGMTEADLARPVIEVKDLQTEKLMFEIYSYGEQTVVIPIEKSNSSPTSDLAKKQIEREFKKYSDNFEVEIISPHKVKIYVPDCDRARIIGSKGSNISKIEKELGISIDLETLGAKTREEKKRIGFHITERGNSIILKIDTPGKMIDAYIEEEFLFTSTSGKKGEIKINRKSDIGKKLIFALDSNKKIYIKG
jgi:ATPase